MQQLDSLPSMFARLFAFISLIISEHPISSSFSQFFKMAHARHTQAVWGEKEKVKAHAHTHDSCPAHPGCLPPPQGPRQTGCEGSRKRSFEVGVFSQFQESTTHVTRNWMGSVEQEKKGILKDLDVAKGQPEGQSARQEKLQSAKDKVEGERGVEKEKVKRLEETMNFKRHMPP